MIDRRDGRAGVVAPRSGVENALIASGFESRGGDARASSAAAAAPPPPPSSSSASSATAATEKLSLRSLFTPPLAGDFDAIEPRSVAPDCLLTAASAAAAGRGAGAPVSAAIINDSSVLPLRHAMCSMIFSSIALKCFLISRGIVASALTNGSITFETSNASSPSSVGIAGNFNVAVL